MTREQTRSAGASDAHSKRHPLPAAIVFAVLWLRGCGGGMPTPVRVGVA